MRSEDKNHRTSGFRAEKEFSMKCVIGDRKREEEMFTLRVPHSELRTSRRVSS